MSSANGLTLEAYCASFTHDNAWSDSLVESSRTFLQKLDLGPVPHICQQTASLPPDVPLMGPLLVYDHHDSFLDAAITLWHKVSPALLAMGELWLRLFASLLAPLGVAYLLWESLCSDDKTDSNNRIFILSSILAVASAVVLTTDMLYVLHYGHQYGLSLLFASSALALRGCLRHRLYPVFGLVLCLLGLTLHLLWDSSSGTFQFGGTNLPHNVPEGLYYDHDNAFLSRVVANWPTDSRTYSADQGATPWMPTGDSRTGLPFLLHKVDAPTWTRVWLPTYDDETVALDISFPPGGHNDSLPLYLVLHGLNGGSQEDYVMDFANRRNADGSTVVVMVARGLMDLYVKGWNVFHGARVDDADAAARALRRTLGTDQVLAGVGYSMGAIVLSNYVARSGPDCALDAAMAISGGLDMRPQAEYGRAMRLWQPMLAKELRDTFVVGKFGERYRRRLSKQQRLELMRATHITSIDEQAVVTYNGFDDLNHYYTEMSAMGDIPIGAKEVSGRITNVSIPFCVLHALDDPLITWESVASNDGYRHPENLVKSGSGNLMILLTKAGGHVGWPLGWNPSQHKWKWMSDAPKGFVESVVKSKLEKQAQD